MNKIKVRLASKIVATEKCKNDLLWPFCIAEAAGMCSKIKNPAESRPDPFWPIKKSRKSHVSCGTNGCASCMQLEMRCFVLSVDAALRRRATFGKTQASDEMAEEREKSLHVGGTNFLGKAPAASQSREFEPRKKMGPAVQVLKPGRRCCSQTQL